MNPGEAVRGIVQRLPQSSSLAPRVDSIFWTLVAVSAGLVLLLGALNLIFLVRYRRGSSAPRPMLGISPWKIEAVWTIVTLAGFLACFAWGATTYLDLERPPAGAAVIDVTARQWMWDVRHANGRREFNTLHVPVGQPVVLRLASEDVIHSLFVPAFRIKQDVVPGKFVTTWFEATKPGTYHLFCTQFCGTAHATMTGEVIAEPPEVYAAWLALGRHDRELVDRGRELFTRYGCSGCHAATSTVHAPALEELFGKQIPLQDGGFVRADEAYLRDSILEPAKQIAAGYPNVMPSFKGVISEGDLLALIEYLRAPANESRTPGPASIEVKP